MTQFSERIFAEAPYGLSKEEKEKILLKGLKELTQWHLQKCQPYRQLLESLGFDRAENWKNLADIPFLPVRLFKKFALESVAEEEVFKRITSSGTTSLVSQVVLDKETSLRQSKALARIVASFVGPDRLPLLVIDTASTATIGSMHNARAAGILGLMQFSRETKFALKDDMSLDEEIVRTFLEKWGNKPFLVFGFTFMVWKYFYKAQTIKPFDFKNGFLIHSGGWKRLHEESVSNSVFKEKLNEKFNLLNIHNFYGMAEQTGSIYMECEQGFLHASIFSDVLIRDYRNWQTLPAGKKGIIQTVSLLPLSYPGHSLLTEDMGVIHGVDDCLCGRKGTRFSVEGRIPAAELRGCSDVHAAMSGLSHAD